MFTVVCMLRQNGKIVGMELLTPQGTVEIPKSKFLAYKGYTKNATITVDGKVCGVNGKLPVRDVDVDKRDELLNKRVSKYTIMHENIAVLTFDRKADSVTVHDSTFLPFALRGLKVIKATDVFEWLLDRISNLDRTYMNMVYLARKVGRDRDKVLADSSGISFSDNFWIKTSDTRATWSELLSLRDTNKELSMVALTG